MSRLYRKKWLSVLVCTVSGHNRFLVVVSVVRLFSGTAVRTSVALGDREDEYRFTCEFRKVFSALEFSTPWGQCTTLQARGFLYAEAKARHGRLVLQVLLTKHALSVLSAELVLQPRPKSCM